MATNPDLTQAEVAPMLGLKYSGLHAMLIRAARKGLLDFDTPLDKLRYSIIPKATDNLNELLDKKDRLATLETMKNTAFKQYVAAEGIHEGGRQVLALNIQMVEPITSNTKVIEGTIIGKPKELAKS